MSNITFKPLSRKRYRCLHPGCSAIIKQARLDSHRNTHRKPREQKEEKTPNAKPTRVVQRNTSIPSFEQFLRECGARFET